MVAITHVALTHNSAEYIPVRVPLLCDKRRRERGGSPVPCCLSFLKIVFMLTGDILIHFFHLEAHLSNS